MDVVKRSLKTLSSDDVTSEEIFKVLKKLDQVEVTLPILEQTNIGKVVGNLKKNKNTKIAKLATQLQNKWKQIVLEGIDSAIVSPTKRKRDEEKSEHHSPNKRKKLTNSEEKKIEEDSKNLNTPKNQNHNQNQNQVKKSNPKSLRNFEKEKIPQNNNNNNEFKTVREEPTISNVVYVESKPLVGTTNNQNRNKAQVMLASAFGGRISEDQLHPIDVAAGIEHEMFSIYKGLTKEYSAKLRSLCSNIKDDKNQGLRDALLNGDIAPDRLCVMSYEELANPELKNKRKEIENWHNEARKIGNKQEGTCELFTCGKCKQNKTSYYQMQTRSADEPMTVFITCQVCGNRWKQN